MIHGLSSLHYSHVKLIFPARRILFLAPLLLALSHLPAQAAQDAEVPGCPAIAVPADSLVVGSTHAHLPSMTVWPRAPGMRYSGCLYLWLDGQLHTIARFAEGRFVHGVTPDLLTETKVLCNARPARDENYACAQMRQEFAGFLAEMETFATKAKLSGQPDS